MAKLVSNLTKYSHGAEIYAAKALEMTANDILDVTRQFVPVDTGALRDSYKIEKIFNGEIRVGSDIEYAPYVEFGTAVNFAQPHFVPAFWINKETFIARLKQLMEAA